MSLTSATRVVVWNEFHHEKHEPGSSAVYPNGIHAAIREGLIKHGFNSVRTATLEEPENGLAEDVLNATDVLVWWGHVRHHDVDDAVV
jgi:trehalose utilization protein